MRLVLNKSCVKFGANRTILDGAAGHAFIFMCRTGSNTSHMAISQAKKVLERSQTTQNVQNSWFSYVGEAMAAL